MGWEQHPLFLGPHSTPLKGVWVRHTGTDLYGYIAHVERPRNRDKITGPGSTEDYERANDPVLWIVHPPVPGMNKTWVASSAHPDQVKKMKGWSNYFEEEE